MTKRAKRAVHQRAQGRGSGPGADRRRRGGQRADPRPRADDPVAGIARRHIAKPQPQPEPRTAVQEAIDELEAIIAEVYPETDLQDFDPAATFVRAWSRPAKSAKAYDLIAAAEDLEAARDIAMLTMSATSTLD